MKFKGFDDQKLKQIKKLEHYCLYYKQFKFADKRIIFLEIKDICTDFEFSIILGRNYDKKYLVKDNNKIYSTFIKLIFFHFSI